MQLAAGDHRADALAHVQRAVAQAPGARPDAPAHGGTAAPRRPRPAAARRAWRAPAAGSPGARCRRGRGRRAPSPRARRAPPPPRAGARRSARRCARPPDAARAGRGRGRPAYARARTRGDALDESSRHDSPRARQCASVSSRLTSSSGRTSRPSSRAHPEQRAPARRRREPVEHRLGLVAHRVPGRDPRAARGREARRRAEPLVAGPGLEVPRARRGPGPLDDELDAERGRQLAAVAPRRRRTPRRAGRG